MTLLSNRQIKGLLVVRIELRRQTSRRGRAGKARTGSVFCAAVGVVMRRWIGKL